MYYELTDRFEVPSDVETTWNFFSTASNLSCITPPWLGFTVRTAEPVVIQNDSILDYTVRAFGFPVHWRTRIIAWQPPVQFIDLQIKGPYTLWHHQHTFEKSAGGVMCSDRVIYKIPGGPIGRVIHAVMIKRQLHEIFEYRRRIIGETLGGIRPVSKDINIVTLT